MSKVVESYEKIEEIFKESNFKFKADEETYNFEFIKKPKILRKDYVSKVVKISKDWSLSYGRKVMDAEFPQRFLVEEKEVLFINIPPKIRELIKNDTITISGFSISKDYEKAKELADYILETLNQSGYVNEKLVKEYNELSSRVADRRS